jgi:hypothetical protein
VGFIQEQGTKFNAAYDQVKKRKVSGIGVGDLVFQALAQFKASQQQKSFHMVHYWTTINDYPKWQDHYTSWSNNGGAQSNVVDLKGGTASVSSQAKRPRGRTNSKGKAKREASLQAVVHIIKIYFLPTRGVK